MSGANVVLDTTKTAIEPVGPIRMRNWRLIVPASVCALACLTSAIVIAAPLYSAPFVVVCGLLAYFAMLEFRGVMMDHETLSAPQRRRGHFSVVALNRSNLKIADIDEMIVLPVRFGMHRVLVTTISASNVIAFDSRASRRAFAAALQQRAPRIVLFRTRSA